MLVLSAAESEVSACSSTPRTCPEIRTWRAGPLVSSWSPRLYWLFLPRRSTGIQAGGPGGWFRRTLFSVGVPRSTMNQPDQVILPNESILSTMSVATRNNVMGSTWLSASD